MPQRVKMEDKVKNTEYLANILGREKIVPRFRYCPKCNSNMETVLRTVDNHLQHVKEFQDTCGACFTIIHIEVSEMK